MENQSYDESSDGSYESGEDEMSEMTNTNNKQTYQFTSLNEPKDNVNYVSTYTEQSNHCKYQKKAKDKAKPKNVDQSIEFIEEKQDRSLKTHN